MTPETKTTKIQVEIDHFLVYRKSRVGIFIGSLKGVLLSDGQSFVRDGETCKIKIKFDLIDLTKMQNVQALEFIIRKSCEEKSYNGTFVKQFTAISISDYISEKTRSVSF